MGSAPTPVRERIAAGFERWGHFVVRWRWATIACMLALSVGLGAQLPRLTTDNSVEAFLHDDDPALVRYNAFRDQFGRDDVTVIAVEPRNVFDLAFLEKLRALHRDLEEHVPHVDEVTSLINARFTRGEGDELIVEDLLEEWPRDAAQAAALRARVFANPLYVDTLISKDGRFTTVTIEPNVYSSAWSDAEPHHWPDGGDAALATSPDRRPHLTEAESAALVDAVREVMERHAAPDMKMHLAGAAVLEERLIEKMQIDLTRFLGMSVLIIVAVLYGVFRRISGVLLPLVTVVLSLVSTMGAMVLMKIPLSLTTEILPPFLLAIGVCGSVHILVVFFRDLARGARRGDAIAYALGHSGLPVLMASLTTAGGLVSFAWAAIAPISELGIVAPLGVMLALVFSVALLPALLAVVPLRRTGVSGKPTNVLLTRAVVGLGDLSARRPWAVVAVAVLLLAWAAVWASRIRIANDELKWLPEGAPLRVATALMDREFNGVVTLEAILETGTANGLHGPALLRRIDHLGTANRSIRHGNLFIGKTMSITDVVKETHQALHGNRREFYAIPDNRQLVAQELLLFEMGGSDDLEELVDSQYGMARVSMKIPWADWMLYPEFLEKMQRHIEAVVGNDVRVTLTGFSALLASAAAGVNITMVRSYVIALIIITPLMILLLGSFRRGLLSMVPNLSPILFTLGVMGWCGFPLDMSNLLVGGVVIGLAVDDTIHFMHGFNRYYAKTGDPYQAVGETLEATGVAMLFTSVVLTAGFLVFTLAYMVNIVTFGLLTALATATAFLADVTLAPALMVLVTRRQRRTALGRGRLPAVSPTAAGASPSPRFRRLL